MERNISHYCSYTTQELILEHGFDNLHGDELEKVKEGLYNSENILNLIKTKTGKYKKEDIAKIEDLPFYVKYSNLLGQISLNKTLILFIGILFSILMVLNFSVGYLLFFGEAEYGTKEILIPALIAFSGYSYFIYNKVLKGDVNKHVIKNKVSLSKYAGLTNDGIVVLKELKNYLTVRSLKLQKKPVTLENFKHFSLYDMENFKSIYEDKAYILAQWNKMKKINKEKIDLVLKGYSIMFVYLLALGFLNVFITAEITLGDSYSLKISHLLLATSAIVLFFYFRKIQKKEKEFDAQFKKEEENLALFNITDHEYFDANDFEKDLKAIVAMSKDAEEKSFINEPRTPEL